MNQLLNEWLTQMLEISVFGQKIRVTRQETLVAFVLCLLMAAFGPFAIMQVLAAVLARVLITATEVPPSKS